MVKPDLVSVYVTASGQLYKDDGMGSLSLAFGTVPMATNDSTASGIGVPVGGVYLDTDTGALTVRRP